jgi:uracil-DNA glycosylase family protein
MPPRAAKLDRSAADFIPREKTLPALRAAADGCQGCELYKNATQTVFGEGPTSAEIMLVGETPGDQEDLQGRPFVGPAGRVLDEALEKIGLDRGKVYVTNVVKHFKWEPRGKRRLHKKPGAREIVACRAWLESEIFAVKPKLIVCLGATAAQALLGRDFRITKQRGEVLESAWARGVIATHHPSAILRAPDTADRERMREEFTKDLRHGWEWLQKC